MTDHGTLSYPDRWPLREYSPPVEDVQRAYRNDKVADAALDNELEWALSKPEPPVAVLIDAEECVIFADGVEVTDRLTELNNDPDSSVDLDLEKTEAVFHDGSREMATTRLTITCEFADLERVFDAIREDDQ